MWDIARRYVERFRVDRAEGIVKKLYCVFMLTLPHIITSLILLMIFPDKWIGIIVMGIFLPDIYFLVYQFYLKLYPPKEDYAFGMIHLSIKTISHIMVYIIVLFLLFSGETIIALSGGLHILEDIIGF